MQLERTLLVAEHRSLAGLCTRKYERTGEQQHQAISNILASSVDIPYVTRMTVQLLTVQFPSFGSGIKTSGTHK